MQERDYDFDGRLILDGMQHHESGTFFFHDEDLGGCRKGAWIGDGHEVDVPAAKQRCVGHYGLVHGIRLAALKSEALTHWAGCNEAGYINEARWPVEAGALKLENCLVASVMAACATVTLADVVEMLRCDR